MPEHPISPGIQPSSPNSALRVLLLDVLSEGKKSAVGVVAASFAEYRQLQELAVYSSAFVTQDGSS
ncbi:hypothetical protein SH139x_003607 [Planctomycetaceae bacterium SH139]